MFDLLFGKSKKDEILNNLYIDDIDEIINYIQ